MMVAIDEHQIKRGRLLKIIADHGAEQLLLTSQASLAWYLDGARIHISLAAPPIVALLVSLDRDEVILTSNESARMVAEELPSWAGVRELAWHEAPADLPVGPGMIMEDAIAAELRAARIPLLAEEVDRFRGLGGDLARLLTDIASSARPDQSERDLAGEIAAGIVHLDAEPLVTLVGGASRSDYRHPLPTTAPIGRRTMLVACARRHGMIINISRWVRFGPASAAEESADQRILEVEAEYFAALRPGRTLAEVFRDGRAGYAKHGFAADEWTKHHQGGVAGYAGRDPRATDAAADLIAIGQAFAWNPTAPGCKVEDTVLLTADGLEILTVDPRWPTVTCADRPRPAVLEL